MSLIPIIANPTMYGTASAPLSGVLQNFDLQSYIVSAAQLRNDIIASGGQVFISQTDTFTANGTTAQWTLSYAPDFNAPIVPALLVNGVSKTIGAYGQGATATQYQVVQIAPGYAILLVGSDGVPANGSSLTLTYQYQADALVRLQQQTSISQASGLPNWGKHTATPVSATGLGPAIQAALTQMTLYAFPVTDIEVVIPELYAGSGIRKGLVQHLDLNRLGVHGDFIIVEAEQQGSAAPPASRKITLKLEG